jgi:hypothetical protein
MANFVGPTGPTGPAGPANPPVGFTGLTGQDGEQGGLGPTGPTGPQGLLGWGGGTTVGATGTPGFKLVDVSSGTSLTVTTASLGTTYYITTALTGITFPSSMSGITSGAFWVFHNNTNTTLSIALTSGTVSYDGNPSATAISLASSAKIMFVYTGSGTGYTAY